MSLGLPVSVKLGSYPSKHFPISLKVSLLPLLKSLRLLGSLVLVYGCACTWLAMMLSGYEKILPPLGRLLRGGSVYKNHVVTKTLSLRLSLMKSVASLQMKTGNIFLPFLAHWVCMCATGTLYHSSLFILSTYWLVDGMIAFWIYFAAHL